MLMTRPIPYRLWFVWLAPAFLTLLPEAYGQDVQDTEIVDASPAELRLQLEPVTGRERIQERIRTNRRDLDYFYRLMEEERPGEVFRIGIEDVVAIALETNQDIEIAAYGPASRAAELMAARGEFDPVAFGNVNYTRTLQEASSETLTFGGIATIEAYRTTGNTGVRGRLHWGTQYSVQLDLNKEATTFNRLRDEWSGGLTITLTQPLLRGFGKAANLARIRIARHGQAIAEEQFRLAVMNSIAEVVRAYWDLVGTIEQVRVREQALANAQRLLELSERRLEIGTGAPLDVSQAQSGVAARANDLLLAKKQVRDSEDRLKTLLNMHAQDLAAPAQLLPTARPQVEDIELREEISVARALELRPEVQSGEIEIASAEVEQKRAANEMLPQLDIVGTNFQGGRDARAEDVFRGIRERTDYSYSVGFQGSVPIGNRAARGSHLAAKVQKRDAELRLERAKTEIMQNVRLAVRDVIVSRQQAELNRLTRETEEINVEAEERRLELGVVTSFDVLQVQENLTAAQVQEVQAQINFEQALVNLQLAEGALLANLGVELEPADDIRPDGFVRSVIPRFRW